MNGLTDKPKKEVTPDDMKSMVNRGMWLGTGTVVMIVLLMTTCTMHSNTYDPARLKEEVAFKQVEVEIERAKVDLQKQELLKKEHELKIIERLVTLGINPVAARCGVYGWSTLHNESNTPCVIAAGKDNTIKGDISKESVE